MRGPNRPPFSCVSPLRAASRPLPAAYDGVPNYNRLSLSLIFNTSLVIPAEAGIHVQSKPMDSRLAAPRNFALWARFRGNDGVVSGIGAMDHRTDGAMKFQLLRWSVAIAGLSGLTSFASAADNVPYANL